MILIVYRTYIFKALTLIVMVVMIKYSCHKIIYGVLHVRL